MILMHARKLLVILLVFFLLIPTVNAGAGVFERLSLESRNVQWMKGTYMSSGASVLQNSDGSRAFYGRIGFVPMLVSGPNELALDLTLHFDAEGDIRGDEWDSARDLIHRIIFFRHNKPEDFFSFSLEPVDDLSFANGTVLRDYANSMRWPLLDRKLAANFVWNSGYDDKAIIFVDDVARPKMLGARGFIQPHDNVIVGATAVTDRDINTRLGMRDVTVGGVDVSFPFETKNTDIKCNVYGEYNTILDRGDGAHYGLDIDMGRLAWKVEHRRFRRDYLPAYFDHLYEMERNFKATSLYTLPSSGLALGWFNELRAQLTPAIRGRISYATSDAPRAEPHWSAGMEYQNPNFAALRLALDYDRKDLYYSGINADDALYQIRMSYDVDGRTHLLGHYKRILDDRGMPATSIHLETRIMF